MFIPCLLFAQPQPPPPIPASAELRQLLELRQQLGRENVYTMPVTVTVTQTVTTIYELDYLRFIRAKPIHTNDLLSMTFKTNFFPLSTNVLISITNSSSVNP